MGRFISALVMVVVVVTFAIGAASILWEPCPICHEYSLFGIGNDSVTYCIGCYTEL